MSRARTHSFTARWLRQHRGPINMIIQSLGKPEVRGMSPAEIVAHVRSHSVPAPGGIVAHALRKSAAHHEVTHGPGPYVDRLREAAKLAEAGAEGEEPRPAPATRLRHALQEHVAPFTPAPGLVADPLTGKPMDPQPEWAGRPPGALGSSG